MSENYMDTNKTPDLQGFVEENRDPLNYSADPTLVTLLLQETILEAVRKGIPLDGYLFPRIRESIRKLSQERYPGERFEPRLTYQSHHDSLRKVIKRKIQLAHGPEELLTTT